MLQIALNLKWKTVSNLTGARTAISATRSGHMASARSLEDVISKAMSAVDRMQSLQRRAMRVAWLAHFTDGQGNLKRLEAR